MCGGATVNVWIGALPGPSDRSVCRLDVAAPGRLGDRASAEAQRRNRSSWYGYLQQMLAEDFSPPTGSTWARTATEIRPRPNLRPHRARGIRGQALTQVRSPRDYEYSRKPSAKLARGYPRDDGNRTAIHQTERLAGLPGKSKVVVLLTDGENNKGTVDPRTRRSLGDIRHQRSTRSESGLRRGPVPTGRDRWPPLRDEPVKSTSSSERGRAHDGRSLLPRDGRASLANIFWEINRLEKTPCRSRLPSLRRGVSRAAGVGLAGVGLELVLGAHSRCACHDHFDAAGRDYASPQSSPGRSGGVRRGRDGARYGERPHVREYRPHRPRRGGEARAPALGLAAGLAAVALSGALGEERIVTETAGSPRSSPSTFSRSMLAEDAKPSRLGRALLSAASVRTSWRSSRSRIAGTSYIPVPAVGGWLGAYAVLDASIDVASEGGTSLAPALAQGHRPAARQPGRSRSRARGVHRPGEAHDSLSSRCRRRGAWRARIHLILVAEGGRSPPKFVRDDRGTWSRGSRMDQGIPSSPAGADR